MNLRNTILFGILSLAIQNVQAGTLRCHILGKGFESEAWQQAAEIPDCTYGVCKPSGQVGFTPFYTRNWFGIPGTPERYTADLYKVSSAPYLSFFGDSGGDITVGMRAANYFFYLTENNSNQKYIDFLNQESAHLGAQNITATMTDFKVGIKKEIQVGVLKVPGTDGNATNDWIVQYEKATLSCQYVDL